jgi:thiamine biosynthesis lipoprotein
MRFLETVMGIPMSIDIRDADDATAATGAGAAFAVLRAADARFSRYRDDSEVSAVNRGMLGASDYSADLREVIALGEDAERASGGAFTLRAPDGSLDTDGVVKGWAAARAARELDAYRIHCYCLNAGGDVVVAGAPEGAAGWNVGIRSVEHPQAMMAVLTVTDGAVATSGAYERGRHIRDGRTGEPADALASATVIARDLTTADVLATLVFAMGADGMRVALENGATGVLVRSADGRLLGAGTVPLASGR